MMMSGEFEIAAPDVVTIIAEDDAAVPGEGLNRGMQATRLIHHEDRRRKQSRTQGSIQE
jgi:hypothetical protein